MRKHKKRKKVKKKQLVFIGKNIKKSNFALFYWRFLHFCTRDLVLPGFSGIFDFAVCGGVLCRAAHERSLFSVIVLHFLLKYRCVPKIGFSADISIDISIDIFIVISIDT